MEVPGRGAFRQPIGLCDHARKETFYYLHGQPELHLTLKCTSLARTVALHATLDVLASRAVGTSTRWRTHMHKGSYRSDTAIRSNLSSTHKPLQKLNGEFKASGHSLHAALVGGVLVGALLAFAIDADVPLLTLPVLALASPLVSLSPLPLLRIARLRSPLLLILLQLLLQGAKCHVYTCPCACISLHP